MEVIFNEDPKNPDDKPARKKLDFCLNKWSTIGQKPEDDTPEKRIKTVKDFILNIVKCSQ